MQQALEDEQFDPFMETSSTLAEDEDELEKNELVIDDDDADEELFI